MKQASLAIEAYFIFWGKYQKKRGLRLMYILSAFINRFIAI